MINQDNYWIVEDCKSFYSKIWDDYIWKYELRCPKCGEVVDAISHILWDVNIPTYPTCPSCHTRLKIRRTK